MTSCGAAYKPSRQSNFSAFHLARDGAHVPCGTSGLLAHRFNA
jgi:hypothetical protein